MKYLIISCYGYKGGELGTPYIYKYPEELTWGLVDDFMYYIEEEHQLTKESSLEELKIATENILEGKLDNIYAGTDEHVVQVWQMDENYHLKQLRLDGIIKLIDFEILKKRLWE